MSKERRRCAIYTRKSSEEGLEQDFNSLDAQREACEAYIKSQKGEGWALLTQRYDDGGVSGGTLTRPALQRLLDDMAANRVDLIVVYKVDRLTRSLADFAKLVERFDAAGASFVSVTQQFNTASSMGRLTLNVLLSFAQFEREVTAERIRDKIGQSKKKGLWMGGPVPLGYDVRDRSLVINEAEAKSVRRIFQLYLNLGCVRRVKEAADRQGLLSKLHDFKSGRRGGLPLTRGRIYHLLANPIYIGKIRHKQECYPGQHKAIVDRETFEAVRTKLKAKASRTIGDTNGTMPSPLAGKFSDETGDRLTPSHAVRRGRRHRYYVSRRLITESGKGDLSGWRLPAKALEDAVVNTIVERLQHSHFANDLLTDVTPEILRCLPDKLAALSQLLQGPDRDSILQAVVAKGKIEPGHLTIKLSPQAVGEHLGLTPAALKQDALHLEGAFTLRRRGVEAKLVMGENNSDIDTVLVKALARGHRYFEAFKAGISMRAIAERDGITQRRVAGLMDLSFLAPDIVTAIVEGRQPTDLTTDRLLKRRQQLLWTDQRAALLAK